PDRGGVSVDDSVCTCRAHRRTPAQWGWHADSTSVTRVTQTASDWRPTARRLWLYEYNSLTLPKLNFSEHSCPFPTYARLCTKSPVREMTRWSMRPSRSVFRPFLRPNSP